MAILLLIILLIVIGAKVVYKDNFVVLEGGLIHDGESADTVINYPQGLNQNNCVVISAQCITSGSNISYGHTFDSASYARGGVALNISLLKNNITIRTKNIFITQDTEGLSGINKPINSSKNYRIVLMKIGD